MRKSAFVLFLCGALGTACPAQEKTEPTRETTLARCTKLLEFGSLNEFFKPTKADAVVALGLLGDQRAVPVLLVHLKNESDYNLRFQTVRALGWLKSKKAVPPLEALLQHRGPGLGDINLREVAKVALEEITGKDYGAKESAAKLAEKLRSVLPDVAAGTPGAQAVPGEQVGEVGKTYRFVFTRPEVKDVVAELLEPPRQSWAKVRVHRGAAPTLSWINLNAVAMIVAVPDKK
jgi:hypothetical protein